MNKYNPNIHHRRSIRLKGYDYSQAGLYFVTICVKNRECLFGEIQSGQMQLNDAGRMIEKWWFELENKFPDIRCDTMVVMPNHFHGIIHNVGADLGVCPNIANRHAPMDDGQSHRNDGQSRRIAPTVGEHTGSPLHRVVQWFKTMTTNGYIRGVKTFGWQPFDGKLWQRNYWEHIIRNEKSYENISGYIISNPIKWNEDTLNPNSE